MSSPGPDIVIKCPYCSAVARRETFRTISFMGHWEWSDGFTASLPSFGADVAQCSQCHRSYWVEAAEIVDQAANRFDPYELDRLRRDWGHVGYVARPDEAGYYRALARGDLCATPDSERNARLRAWWRRNDPARQSGHNGDHSTWTEEGRANLETLISQLRDAGANLLLQAEGYRELGDFEGARRTLGRIDAEPAREVRNKLLELCEAGHTQVHMLRSADAFRR